MHTALLRTITLLAICEIAFWGVRNPQAVSQSGQQTPRDNAKTTPRRQSSGSAESFDRLAGQAQDAADSERIPEAIALYERLTKMRPTWSEGWWHLGTLCFDSQQFERASSAFAQFVHVEQKQKGPGLAMLGLSEFELGHYPQALNALESGLQLKVGPNPEFARNVLYHDGILNTLLGKPELGERRLTLAVKQAAAASPQGSKEAVLADADLLEALGLASLHIAKLPKDIGVDQKDMVRLAGKAQALSALDDRGAADALFKECIARYGTIVGVNYLYGEFLLNEDSTRAMEMFRRELEVAPKSVAPRVQIALDMLQNGSFEEGMRYAKEAADLDPGNFAVHITYGRLLLGAGKAKEAVEELRQAVKQAPASPDAHFALARALERAGDKEGAKRERVEFQRLNALRQESEKYE